MWIRLFPLLALDEGYVDFTAAILLIPFGWLPLCYSPSSKKIAALILMQCQAHYSFGGDIKGPERSKDRCHVSAASQRLLSYRRQGSQGAVSTFEVLLNLLIRE